MNRTHLLRYFFLPFLLIAASAGSAWATHLRAGEITVERVSCNSLTFRITVTVFTNTINTNVLFGGEDDWLDFGDGNRMLIPEQEIDPDHGHVVFVLTEFQVCDKATAVRNESGQSSHEAYKARQQEKVRARLLREEDEPLPPD